MANLIIIPTHEAWDSIPTTRPWPNAKGISFNSMVDLLQTALYIKFDTNVLYYKSLWFHSIFISFSPLWSDDNSIFIYFILSTWDSSSCKLETILDNISFFYKTVSSQVIFFQKNDNRWNPIKPIEISYCFSLVGGDDCIRR